MSSSPPEARALPPAAARLRVDAPAPYVYRSALKRRAAAALDAAGDLLLGPPAEELDWAGVRKLALLRLDHLGDLLHLLPLLRRLRGGLPRARLDLWVGPWGRELAELFADADAVRVAPASWFRRPARRAWPWGEILGLGRALRAEGYDAALEPRGDLRHHLALWLSGVPRRGGQALTAGGFLLSRAARWRPELHEQEQNLNLAEHLGLPKGKPFQGPYLKIPAAVRGRARALARELKLGSAAVLVQAACGTAAKRWSPAAWAALLEALPSRHRVCLLGSAAEAEEMRALARRVKRPLALAAGRLDLAGLAAFLGGSRLLISVDSGPAHLAAVQGVPVLSLFSGTNRSAQWAPRGPRVKLLQAAGFPCAPCELADCPYGNACMAALRPEAVLKEALKMLRP